MTDIPYLEGPAGPELQQVEETMPPVLNPTERRVAGCVGCIMSRYVGQGQEPDISAPAITVCTGIGPNVVRSALRVLERSGALEQAVPTRKVPRHIGSPGVWYLPIEGQAVIPPQPREGCATRPQEQWYGVMGRRNVQLLACMAHLTILGKEVTFNAINDCGQACGATQGAILRKALENFVDTEVAERRYFLRGGKRLARYALGENGLWLADGLISPVGCKYPRRGR